MVQAYFQALPVRHNHCAVMLAVKYFTSRDKKQQHCVKKYYYYLGIPLKILRSY